jgi:hypothetical protein
MGPMPFASRRAYDATLSMLATCALAACGPQDRAADLASLPLQTAQVELRVGALDDPVYALTWFREMEVGPDGTMYTLHPLEQVVRVFDAEGTARGTIGRRGDGPGEFQNAAAMGWVGDTLWVLDYQGYRFNQFDPAGTFLGSFSVPFVMGETPGVAHRRGLGASSSTAPSTAHRRRSPTRSRKARSRTTDPF